MSIRQKVMLLVMVAMVCLLSFSLAEAGTKYDLIIATSFWQEMLATMKKEIAPQRHYMDYLRLLVDHGDVVAMAKRGGLDKEKSKLVMSNSESFLTYLHFLIFAHQLGKQNPPIKDAEIVYITGVIKSPKAQAARTSSEYEVEKAVLRGMYTYRLWEGWREPGYLKTVTDEQIDIMYKQLRTRK
jgi:hypothetical protein